MREIDEFSDDEPHIEGQGTKVKDIGEHSLTTEERDEIIRKYNAEHSIHLITTDEFEKTEQSKKKKNEVDSGDFPDIEKSVSDTEPQVEEMLNFEGLVDYKVRFESIEEVERAVQQHPHVQRKFTLENYEKCAQYIRVITEDDDVCLKEIAEKENLEEDLVRIWRDGGRPKPMLAIEGHEIKRLEHENRISKEALKHRIAPKDVHDIYSNVQAKENLSVKELTGLVEEIHKKIDNPKPSSIWYAELYDSEIQLTKDPLRNLALQIRSNREIIQSEMNMRLGLDEIPNHEIRIGVTDNRLYYWHINTDPDEWVHVLAEQKFYMSKEDKIQLIDEMRNHLHTRRDGKTTEYYLNDLISQLTKLNKPAANRINLYERVHSFDGEVMHLIGDLKGKSIEDFKSVILHIGIRKAARVSDLRFPEIHKFRMRFVGIAESDCSLDHEGRFFYYEKDIERQRIVIDFFHEFGDFKLKRGKDNAVQIYLPRSFGVLAECWGIPYGDKAIHNRGLHESIINEDIVVKIQYLREMVPEDGCICGTVVSIRRHNVLHAGIRMEKYRYMYGIEPVVNQKHIQFVIDEGTPQKSQLCYEDGDLIRLHLTKIQNIAKDKTNINSDIAKDLLRIIGENPQRLLYDEKTHMTKPLGINMNIRERFVQYYTGSQRLSLSSYGSTAGKKDAVRWILIAPPNHPIKMKDAIELITSDVEYSRNIAEQIKKDGLPIDSHWDIYLK